MYKQMTVLSDYKILNKAVCPGGIVFFGADSLFRVPLAELCEASAIDEQIYNRSLEGLLLEDAEMLLDTCVYDLSPKKVFINIGENDIAKPEFNPQEFIEKYEWLLYTIHSKCNAALYILSVTNGHADKINNMLRLLAAKHGCEYIDLNNIGASISDFFSKIRIFIRSNPITFFDAMNIKV